MLPKYYRKLILKNGNNTWFKRALRKNEKDIIIKFNDNDNKISTLCKERKETINWVHKGEHLGKLISLHIKPNETVIFKNVNFTNYDTIQCNSLLRSLFKKPIILIY